MGISRSLPFNAYDLFVIYLSTSQTSGKKWQNIRLSQLYPASPVGQRQKYRSKPSRHVPPFTHGLDAHSSTSETLSLLLKHWQIPLKSNPLIATLKPLCNGPSYSNTVIGTLAVDGWAVTVTRGTARRGLGAAHCFKYILRRWQRFWFGLCEPKRNWSGSSLYIFKGELPP